MELKPTVQNYDWGKPAATSIVAKLYNAGESEVVLLDVPYAELWMGTHPNGPAIVKSLSVKLKNYLDENQGVLGCESVDKFGKDLPFLLKVLSVNKALSIQVHPSKKHAEELHASRPDLYKDPNHKPELAIALTDFEAMCGFRPVSEIQRYIKDVPELREVIGAALTEKFIESTESDCDNCLKDCFKALMTCSQPKITEQLAALLERFKRLDTKKQKDQLASLIVRLNSQFPNDVGCFAPYFLNVITLKPGEAIFLGPNEPHAYLSGDCVECMACSDNVVRAGLTPKFKDVETLCDMLIYNGGEASEKLFQPIIENEFTSIFKPPVPDFAVAKISVNSQSKNEVELIKRAVCSILLCISGEAKYKDHVLSPGKVFFVPANEGVVINDIRKDLSLYQAMANL